MFTVVGCRSLQETLYLCPCPPFFPPRALRKEAHMLEHTAIRRAVAQRGTGRGWLCKVSARAESRAAAGHLFSACAARDAAHPPHEAHPPSDTGGSSHVPAEA